MTDRIARFEERRARLATLSDEQLKERFWELNEALMTPVVELARTHTSPSIERSVLMRMGIDSVTCHPVVDALVARHLLGKGAGHAVLKLATRRGCSLTEAAAAIAEDPSVLDGLFEGK
ncbi:MAG: D-ornithine 4,5-aminomutase subunit OraS [Propioniciclava sp.]|uniref:D-ornithine 4,5-aminomutase subunit OraS n=1 Tax=Propioniciclava sp. TaxID=2038686 RepID=UPI0039E379BA